MSEKISGMAVASALTGTELMEVVQGGVNKQTTAQDIADLGAGGGGTITSVNGDTGPVVVLDATDVGADPAGSASTVAGNLAAHIADATDAHAGTAITNTAAGNIAATTVQAAINELDAEKVNQLTTFRRETASHTLDATDLANINIGRDVVIELNVASANDLTVPANATQAFPVGTKITGIQYGVGQTSIVAAGGVTIHTSSGDFLARAQYAAFLLEKVAADEWYLSNGTTPGSVISSGTYTPSLTNTTNVAASTAYACQYLRLGATVTVSGKVSIDPTSTGDTVLGMSIPIASAFSQEFHAGGSAIAYAVAGLSVAIFADATNDRLTFRFTAVDTTNRDFFFTVTYQII